MGGYAEVCLEALASEEESGVGVLDGQGIAVDAVFGFEFALEVSSPDFVRFGDGSSRFARVSSDSRSSWSFHTSVAFEDAVDGGDCRYEFRWPFLAEQVLDFGSSPIPSFLESEDVVDDFGRSSM